MGRFEDLTGQKFGRLTVLRRDERVHRAGAFWVCHCECGQEKSVSAAALKRGATQSCGCLNKEIISKSKDLTDMIGRRFGKLVVLRRNGTYISPSGQKKPLWLCKCDCGQETNVVSQDLKSGHTRSCGCIPKKPKGSGLFDLTGKRFGKLVVIQRAADYCYKSKERIMNIPRWLCRCDCGNEIIAQGGNLKNGNTTNCGCDRIKSKGELAVSQFLTNHQIKYLSEYSFDDLRNKTGNLLRFDFAILNDNNDVIVLVEYQGKQHYIEDIAFGLYQRKYSDKMKKDYCKSKNILLYEIKYDDNLEEALSSLLGKIQSFN